VRVQICAVGRLRRGPERDLTDAYLDRFDRVGRGLNLGPARVIEVDDRKRGGAGGEAALLRAALPEGATLCVLDQRGDTMTSEGFARYLAARRDGGVRDLAFVIGGADGTAADLRAEADGLLSFGPMVWPHLLARVMLAEQIYRAASILAGSPYHRA